MPPKPEKRIAGSVSSSQTVVVPEIVAVGSGLTVIIAVPEKVPIQFASLKSVIE